MKVTVVLLMTVFGVSIAADLQASKIMQALMGTANDREKRSLQTSGVAFQTTDTDHNGQISLDELIGFVRSTSGMNVDGFMRNAFETLFNRFDTDGNGSLGPNEYNTLLQTAMQGMY